MNTDEQQLQVEVCSYAMHSATVKTMQLDKVKKRHDITVTQLTKDRTDLR